jgi:L-aspartate oxidase
LEPAVSDGRCAGVHAAKDGRSFAVLGGGVVLATGGLGALYEHTTNSPFATGDGVALAVRAGAEVRDLHYLQFHPTALYEPDLVGGRFLVSETVRGEGGVLVDAEGREFVDHPAGSLAPRDVVAREIWSMMGRTDSPCAYLDITNRPKSWLKERFPTVYARCLRAGVDMATEPIPVVPAAHYSCGGVATDLSGRTGVEGLWAAGEVASTGLHGANRLASTSLLEGLVFGRRAGEDAARCSGPRGVIRLGGWPQVPQRAPEGAWCRLRRILWERAGIVRGAEGLRRGLGELLELEAGYGDSELRGPLLVARTLLEDALADTRSRGCHYRVDTEPEGRRIA